jgi:hypothetical protein
MVWLALAMVTIFGIVALTMDGGRLMDKRRQTQGVADAAALAAAADLYANFWQNHGADSSGSAKQAALASAAANAPAGDGASTELTVNIPPASGSFAGQAGYVEVIANTQVPASFARVFTGQDLPVRARSVAVGQPMKLGLILLRPSGADALLNNSLALTVVNSPIIVNSSDPAAYDQAGFGVAVASRFDITGGYVNSGGLILGTIRTGVRPVPDPLAFLPVPDASAATVRSAAPLKLNAPLPTILQPGIYRGGIAMSGSSSAVLMPGVYIMDGGGFQVGDLATVTGLEVTIYNTAGAYPAGPITIDSLGKVALAAPLSGTYQGINFFQNRGLPQPLSFTGHGLTAITGVVYAANAEVNATEALTGAVEILGGAYVCNSMQVNGVGSISVDLGLNPPRIPDVHLAE